MRGNHYFIAIIPNSTVCKEIESFKTDFAEHFDSRQAQKVMPHITLKAPFKLQASRHDELVQWFQEPFPYPCPFQAGLKNFSAFFNRYNPVVYVDPILHPSLLSLQKNIITNFQFAFPEINISDLEFRFQPHITIAYRDLSPENFEKAWMKYKMMEYEAFFDVNDFHLLQHDTKKWNVNQTHVLST